MILQNSRPTKYLFESLESYPQFFTWFEFEYSTRGNQFRINFDAYGQYHVVPETEVSQDDRHPVLQAGRRRGVCDGAEREGYSVIHEERLSSQSCSISSSMCWRKWQQECIVAADREKHRCRHRCDSAADLKMRAEKGIRVDCWCVQGDFCKSVFRNVW